MNTSPVPDPAAGPASELPVPALAGRPDWLDEPSRLHPALWRARSGGGGGAPSAGAGEGVPTGFAALDAELPGGGWPVRVLTELLLSEPGVGELRLLAPLLRRLAVQGRSVLWFDPPAGLHAPALQELGCPPGLCLVVRPPAAAGTPAGRRAPPGAALGWALEQALRSGQAGAVLAWPGTAARPEALRRLQLAAQAHEGPVFLLREAAAARQSSPATLRLVLAPAGADELELRVLKRRGPALETPLRLPLQPVLSERALARAQRLDAARHHPASGGGRAGAAGALLDSPGAGHRQPPRAGGAEALPA